MKRTINTEQQESQHQRKLPLRCDLDDYISHGKTVHRIRERLQIAEKTTIIDEIYKHKKANTN